MNWTEIEDEKYSDLYKRGYPDSSPYYVIKRFKYDKEQYVCDLGCGLGILAEYFNKYIGVDVSEFVIKENKVQYENDNNKKFYHKSIDDLEFLKDEFFDLVLCLDVLEHIPPEHLEKLIKEISTLKTKKFIFHISFVESKTLDNDGNNLHLSILSLDEWMSLLKKYFSKSKVRIIKLEYHFDIEIQPLITN